MGDEFLLRELMENLVANAIQYTPDGGHVAIGCALRESERSCIVEDSGPGIAPAERPKVFKRFYRVPGSNADGSGLGLTIAREIARDHAALIEIITPAGGSGTRIEVRFPHHAAPRAPRAKRAGSASAQLSQRLQDGNAAAAASPCDEAPAPARRSARAACSGFTSGSRAA